MNRHAEGNRLTVRYSMDWMLMGHYPAPPVPYLDDTLAREMGFKIAETYPPKPVDAPEYITYDREISVYVFSEDELREFVRRVRADR